MPQFLCSKNVYSILGIMGKVLGFQLITAFTKFLNDLDLEECSIYGFKRRIQLQGSHGYWHPFQQGKTNLLIQTTSGVLEKKECVNLLPFMTQIRIGLTVNDRSRFCAKIPSQEILVTMVKLS